MSKKAGRRRIWRRIAITLGAVAVIGATITVLLAVGTFDVHQIRFRGLHRVSFDEAYAAIDIAEGDLMFTLDTRGAEQALAEIPWVGQALVQRRWPATVDVDVLERRPVAVALSETDSGRSDAWVLVDAQGRVLTPALATPPTLPRLSGIAAAPEPGRYLADDSHALLAVLRATASQPDVGIVDLWRDGREEMWARARLAQDDGAARPLVTVSLGDDTAIAAKTAAIAAVIGDVSSPNVLLDVSVPHLPVLRPISEPQPDSA